MTLIGFFGGGVEDYYSGEGEADGRWTGSAAAELGLEGNVGADQLTAMLTGKNPVDDEPLLRMGGVPSGRGAVPGFDLTFSAPKSVSLLWALGEEPTQAAVRQARALADDDSRCLRTRLRRVRRRRRRLS